MMDRSFQTIEWKGKGAAVSPVHMFEGALDVAPPMHAMPVVYVANATFNRCLAAAAQQSGMDDQDIADEIHISHGYMSRFMRGVAQQWARRLVGFMRTTHSIAPLQWIAAQMDCDVVPRAGQAGRVAQLRQELAMLTGGRAG